MEAPGTGILTRYQPGDEFECKDARARRMLAISPAIVEKASKKPSAGPRLNLTADQRNQLRAAEAEEKESGKPGIVSRLLEGFKKLTGGGAGTAAPVPVSDQTKSDIEAQVDRIGDAEAAKVLDTLEISKLDELEQGPAEKLLAELAKVATPASRA